MNQAPFHLHQLLMAAPVASSAPFHLHQPLMAAPVASPAPFHLHQLLMAAPVASSAPFHLHQPLIAAPVASPAPFHLRGERPLRSSRSHFAAPAFHSSQAGAASPTKARCGCNTLRRP